MFRHIVLLSLSEEETAGVGGGLEGARSRILEALGTLPHRIPEIRSYVFGADAGLAEGNAHVGVVADFDDRAGWEAYRDHPAHREVIDTHIAPVLADRRAIQYEC